MLAQYDARHRAELEATRDLPTGSFGARRDEFLLPVGAEVGRFLRALAVGRRLKLGAATAASSSSLVEVRADKLDVSS